MKKVTINGIRLVLVVCLSFVISSLKAQEKEGVIWVKFKSSSSIVWSDYDGELSGPHSHIQSLIDDFEVSKIYRPFLPAGTNYFDRVYQLEFSLDTLKDDFMDSLDNLSYVDFTETPTFHNPTAINLDTSDRVLGHLKNVRAYTAWNKTKGDTNVVIAILDYPIMKTHEDLDNVHYWRNWGEIPGDGIDNDGNGYIDDFDGYNTRNDSSVQFFEYFNASKLIKGVLNHGTQVASVVFAEHGINGSTQGISPECSLMPINITTYGMYKDTQNAGSRIEIRNEYEGVIYAAKNGADIINLSFGGINIPRKIEQKIFDFADSMGSIVIAGAGNDNNLRINTGDRDNFHYFLPAAYNHVISVASVANNNRRSWFSNYDTFAKVNIYAPGEGVYVCDNYSNSAYVISSGTSLSSPLVAGAIGLMKSENQSMSNDSLVHYLYASCDSINYPNFDLINKLGNGKLNANGYLEKKPQYLLDFYKNDYGQISYPGDSVTLIATDRPNSTYKWFWGDGTVTQTTSNQNTHLYTSIDLLDIKVVVYDQMSSLPIDSLTKNKFLSIIPVVPTKRDPHRKWIFGMGLDLDFTSGKPTENRKNNKYVLAQSANFTAPDSNELEIVAMDSLLKFVQPDNERRIYHNPQSYPIIYNDTDGLWDLPLEFTGNEAYSHHSYQSAYQMVPGWLSEGYIVFNVNMDHIDQHSRLVGPIYSFTETDNFGEPISDKRGIVHANDAEIFDTDFMGVESEVCVIPNPEKQEYWLLLMPKMNGGYNAGVVFKYRFFDTLGEYQTEFVDTTIIKGALQSNVNNIYLSGNNKKLAIYNSGAGSIELLNFNDITGELLTIELLEGPFKQGVKFSPNNQRLYATEIFGGTYRLNQYDLTQTNIASSRRTITVANSFNYTDMKSSPNGVIYLNNTLSKSISAISKPDELLLSDTTNECGYVEFGYTFNQPSDIMVKNDTLLTTSCFPVSNAITYPDSVTFIAKRLNCDSFEISSNVPSYYYKEWDYGINTNFISDRVILTLANYKEGVDLILTSYGIKDTIKTENLLLRFADFDYEYYSCDSIKIWLTSKDSCNATNSFYKNGILIANDIDTIYTTINLAGDTFMLESAMIKNKKFLIPHPQAPNINNGITKISLTNGVAKLYNTNTRFSSYVSFVWYYNNQPVTSLPITDTFYARKPGKYMIYTTTACGDVVSQTVEVCYDCGDNTHDTTYSALDYTFVTGTNTNLSSGTTWRLSGEVTVDSAATLNIYGDVVFEPCSKLRIKRGGHLNIDGSFLGSCGIWKGILVEGNPNVNGPRHFFQNTHGTSLIKNSTISNAIVALRTEDGGFALMDNDTFINNYSNVWFRNYDYTDNSGVSNSFFGNNKGINDAVMDTSGCLDSTVQYNWYYHSAPNILTENVHVNMFTDNRMEDDKFLMPGPPKDHISYIIGESCRGQQYSGNTFVSTHNDWVFHLNYADSISITGNEMSFSSNYYSGAPALHAIYMTQSTGGNIEDNTISNAYTGVEYYYDSTAYTDSLKIYGNEFTDVNIGIFAATTEFAVNNDISTNTYTNIIPIKTECNEFDGSEIGIAGCGNWLPQGGRVISTSPTSAGNRFISTMDASAVLYHTSNIPYRWSHRENVDGEKDPKPSDKTGSVTINGNLISDVSLTVNAFEEDRPQNPFPKYYFNPNCASERPSLSQENTIRENRFIVYPNPSQHGFNVEASNGLNFSIKLFTLEGKLILMERSRSGHASFDLEASQGLYILRIEGDNQVTVKKIMKE